MWAEEWKSEVKQAIHNSALCSRQNWVKQSQWCANSIIKYNATAGDKQKTQQDCILGGRTESQIAVLETILLFWRRK